MSEDEDKQNQVLSQVLEDSPMDEESQALTQDAYDEEPSILSYRAQLAQLQNRLLELQNMRTYQVLRPGEDEEDYDAMIAEIRAAIRSLRDSESLSREDIHPPAEADSVASSASDASVQATFQGDVPSQLSLRTCWQPQQPESPGSSPPSLEKR
eukprot:CAMPEP_0175102364 /NCGR_PEP_ID=MMETSP0086_2-20121207/8392_1 /TAXON_ID=136419 /ORGANISM="Unknown Unknown, Strain D1" /LENGTH=153 /DNA_ID=CAMNT_0016377159 /DNA_START=173 /DNA_END=630 /DNA_ORIENTATION=-